jgi:hypothetical protein
MVLMAHRECREDDRYLTRPTLLYEPLDAWDLLGRFWNPKGGPVRFDEFILHVNDQQGTPCAAQHREAASA